MAYLSREEYLKRYLSADDEKVKTKKKRKKVKPAVVQPKIRIVDDDVDFDSLLPANLKNTLEEDVGDNDPTIADFVDERPENVIQLEQFRQDDRWKILGKDKEPGSPSTKRSRHDSSCDNSPVRSRQDLHNDQTTASRQRHDSDASPPRKYEDSDASPVRRKGHDSSSDGSSSKRHKNFEKSSQKVKRHDSDSDESPRRRGTTQDDSDASPPRRRRRSDSDESPPRNNKVNRHDSDSDVSPPRKRTIQNDSDASPPRRNRHSDSDASPPRKKKGQTDLNNSRSRNSSPGSDSDISVERKGRKDSDSDASPPRKGKTNSHSYHSSHRKQKKVEKEHSSRKEKTSSRPKRSRWNSPDSEGQHKKVKGSKDNMHGDKPVDVDDRGRSKKTLSGQTAGLSSAQQMMEEARKLKEREDRLFKQMDSDQLGKDAKTVHRLKGGGRRNLQEEQEKEAEEEARKAAKAAQYKKWGKGLKQQVEHDANIDYAMRQVEKTLTRHKDDKDMNEMLKQQEREGDPMLAFLKKKKDKERKKDIPRYKGPEPPPNRFKIWPGYRWDGVDRSNGFEKKLFAKASDRKAVSAIAHKWSTEDM